MRRLSTKYGNIVLSTLAPEKHSDTPGLDVATNKRPKVLVVDDEAITRSIVNVKIRVIGADVSEAEDGTTALSLLGAKRFDLVIVDLDMPKMTGIELISRIRNELQLKHLPIVVLTGSEIKTALNAALLAGATSFMQKPLNWSCFGPHIRHLLRI